MRRFFYFFLPLLFSLAACSIPLEKAPDLQETCFGFTQAMRWQDYIGASKYLQKELREEFLQQFEDDDLHIVESRIVQVQQVADEQSATIDYYLEYYRLPSNRVKKWRWQQQWQFVQQEEAKVSPWLIQNAPPAFP